ncbi:MAG: hypothetical protein KI790_06445 [Cyclobacteriaceae bacterium]|nr:hypothetical protein [Cyclobacteriaceae bacterium HetDA_MAG_MS6]
MPSCLKFLIPIALLFQTYLGRSQSPWTFSANFVNIDFHWKYGLERSSVVIKATNRGLETVTIKILATGGDSIKEMTFYSLVPGEESTNPLCASLVNDACAHIKSVTLSLLSVEDPNFYPEAKGNSKGASEPSLQNKRIDQDTRNESIDSFIQGLENSVGNVYEGDENEKSVDQILEKIDQKTELYDSKKKRLDGNPIGNTSSQDVGHKDGDFIAKETDTVKDKCSIAIEDKRHHCNVKYHLCVVDETSTTVTFYLNLFTEIKRKLPEHNIEISLRGPTESQSFADREISVNDFIRNGYVTGKVTWPKKYGKLLRWSEKDKMYIYSFYDQKSYLSLDYQLWIKCM